MRYFSSFNTENKNLSKYINEVHDFPMLGNIDEFEIAREWINNKNPHAADTLIKSHLKLVVKIAKGYSGCGLPLHDLISEGNIGILQAINHFNPELGFKFSTYSSWWIKSKIQEYIFNSKSLVKLSATKANKKLFFHLKKVKKMLGIDKISSENINELASNLNIKKEIIVDADNRLSASDFSITSKVNNSEDASTWEEFIIDDKASAEDLALEKQEFKYRSNLLKNAMNSIPERERNIIIWYRLTEPPFTLSEIGKKMNLSKERIRQLEERAFFKLKEFMKHYANEDKKPANNVAPT